MYIEYYGSLCYIHEDARASSDFNFDTGNILTRSLFGHSLIQSLHVSVKLRCIHTIDVIVCRCHYGISKAFWGRIERS